MRLTLKFKLGAAFGVLAILMGVLGATAITQLKTVNDKSTEIADNWMPSINYVHRINTATSDLRIKEYNHVVSTSSTDMRNLESDIDQILSQLNEDRKTYEKLISSPEERKIYDSFASKFKDYMDLHDDFIEASRLNDSVRAIQLLERARLLFDDFSADALKLVEMNVKSGQLASVEGDTITDQAQTMIISVLVVSILLAIISATWIVLNISRAISSALALANAVADGNLNATASVRSNDEIKDLIEALNTMVTRLKDVVADVTTATGNVASGAQEMSAASEQLSQGAAEQASSTEEASSSIEQMAANIKQNADNAGETENIARQAAKDAETSGKAVGDAVKAMETIAEKILIVQEIARQTDLLALNAAVEAARAGEHGRGFAVVASEVRKLAERSQAAALEISGLSGDTVKAAQSAGEMLTKLVPDIQKTAELIAEISAASNEQNAGAGQINAAIQQLDKVTQQNTSAAEEMSSTAEELASQAEQLQATISYFRLDESGGGSERRVARPKVSKAAGISSGAKAANNGDGRQTKTAVVASETAGKRLAKKANGGFTLDMGEGRDALDGEFVRHGTA